MNFSHFFQRRSRQQSVGGDRMTQSGGGLVDFESGMIGDPNNQPPQQGSMRQSALAQSKSRKRSVQEQRRASASKSKTPRMFKGDNFEQYQVLYQIDPGSRVDFSKFLLNNNKKCGTDGIFGDIHEAIYEGGRYAVKLWSSFNAIKEKEKDVSLDDAIRMMKSHKNKKMHVQMQ